jgi:ABC-2 type transport system permease protein
VSNVEALAIRPHDQPFAPERSPFLWLVEREILRFLNIWHYAVLGPVLSAVLFVVVFGSALGRHVDAIDGIGYGKFIIGGLLAQAILSVGFFNGTTSLYEARHDKYIHDVFASPLRWWEINAALVTGGMARGVIVGAGFMAIAVPLAHIGAAVRPLVFGFGTLGVLIVAAQIGVIAGSLAKSLDQVYSMESIVVLPLGVLGGVFYSAQRLPPPWDVVSGLNPVFWLVQVERIGLLGVGDVSAASALLAVWVLALVLSIWSAAIFGSGRLKA